MDHHPHQRPGRRPIGDQALTTAERKRRSRELLDQNGFVEVTVHLNKVAIAFVDQIAPAWGSNRAHVLKDLLEVSVWRFKALCEQSNSMRQDGASDEVVATFLREHLTLLPGLEAMDSATRQRMANWKET